MMDKKLQGFPLEEVAFLTEVDSTNDEAKRLLQRRNSVLVVAETQRRGRGRRGRRWESPPGGLWLSLGFRVPERRNLSFMPILAGVAVAEGLRRLGFPAQVDWPNDILIEGKKVAGILVEVESGGGRPASLVIGIGIDVNIPEEELQSKVEGTSVTSLMSIAGHRVDKDRVLLEVLEGFFRYWSLWEADDLEPVRGRWKELTVTLNRRVRVLDHQGQREVIEGVPVDLDRDGALLIRDPKGELQRVIEGQLSYLDPPI